MPPGADDELTATAIYLRTQEAAWLRGQIVFAVRGRRLEYIPADAFRPTAETAIEYVAFPPHWRYTPKRQRRA